MIVALVHQPSHESVPSPPLSVSSVRVFRSSTAFFQTAPTDPHFSCPRSRVYDVEAAAAYPPTSKKPFEAVHLLFDIALKGMIIITAAPKYFIYRPH